MGTQRQIPKSGGFVPCLVRSWWRAAQQRGCILTIHWWFTSNTRTSPSFALYSPGKAPLALSRGSCYTQTTRAGKGLVVHLKPHSTSLCLHWGSSHGFASGNDENKLSVDFKNVLASIKVILSFVASIIPTIVGAEFFPQLPPLFLAPFIVKKFMWLCSHHQKYSVLIFPVLINLFTSLYQSIPDVMILAGSVSHSLLRAEQH